MPKTTKRSVKKTPSKKSAPSAKIVKTLREKVKRLTKELQTLKAKLAAIKTESFSKGIEACQSQHEKILAKTLKDAGQQFMKESATKFKKKIKPKKKANKTTKKAKAKKPVAKRKTTKKKPAKAKKTAKKAKAKTKRSKTLAKKK